MEEVKVFFSSLYGTRKQTVADEIEGVLSELLTQRMRKTAVDSLKWQKTLDLLATCFQSYELNLNEGLDTDGASG